VLVYSTVRKVAEIRAITLLWAAVATLSALRSLVQFWQKYQESQALHRNFYDFYIAQRITGFMSHWMTFGAEEMIVFLRKDFVEYNLGDSEVLTPFLAVVGFGYVAREAPDVGA
jgi:hypothetical protein